MPFFFLHLLQSCLRTTDTETRNSCYFALFSVERGNFFGVCSKDILQVIHVK